MDKNDLLKIVDGCLTERLETMEARPRSGDVRNLSVTCQKVLYEVYNEARANGAMGEAEDILRNDNIKAAIGELPESVRNLARDIIACAHGRIQDSGGA